MSTRRVCDYPDCGQAATYRIVAHAHVPARVINPEDLGIDTCDEHYNLTHPGKRGGGWWDDPSVEVRRGAKPRSVAQ